MVARTVRSGFIVYTDVDGRPLTGFFGEEVDVHKKDVERFDRLNPEEPEVEDLGDPDVPEPESYEGVNVKDLKDLIATRNEGREDADKISPAEPGNRPELVAALVADDEKNKQD